MEERERIRGTEDSRNNRRLLGGDYQEITTTTTNVIPQISRLGEGTMSLREGPEVPRKSPDRSLEPP